MSEPTYGFVGIGAMGAPIAHRLLLGPWHLIVFDVDRQACDELVRAGAEAESSAAAVGRRCELVGVCVRDDAQLLTVMSSLLAEPNPDLVILNHSTVSPATCEQADRLARQAGVGFVDACVSGGREAAQHGELALLVGADQTLVDRCGDYFQRFAGQVFHLGGVGTGSIAKLANNMMAIQTILATHEALQLAALAGIDVETMLAVANASTGGSTTTRTWLSQDWESLAPPRFEGVGLLGVKDLHHAARLARDRGLELEVLDAVATVLDRRLSLPTTTRE